MAGQADRDHPGVIAPPPFIFLGFLILGWALDRWLETPGLGLEPTLRKGVAVFLIIAGFALEVWAGGLFRKARTNIVPWSPSTALVTAGPYRFTRNPMYLGFTLTYLGLAIGLDSPIALALLLPCLLLMTWGVIAREERYLEGKFGEPYRAYRRSVRRWL